MRYLTYPERQAWEPLKRGDVVLAKDLHDGRDVVYLLLASVNVNFDGSLDRGAWECLVLDSACSRLEPGSLCTPAEGFLNMGERL